VQPEPRKCHEALHLAMNNNRRDYPAINGMELKEMLLEDWHPPDWETLGEDRRPRRRSSWPHGCTLAEHATVCCGYLARIRDAVPGLPCD
jgi:hypothetical protein